MRSLSIEVQWVELYNKGVIKMSVEKIIAEHLNKDISEVTDENISLMI